MGTLITLQIGDLDIDWSKNSRGSDHGALFQERDRHRVRSGEIDDQDDREADQNPVPTEIGFSRPLRDVVARLELLGFTINNIKEQYSERVDLWREEQSAIADEDEPPERDALSFEEFCAFATEYPLHVLDDTFISSSDAASEAKVHGRFASKDVIDRLPRSIDYDDNAYSELSYFGSLIGILHPYSVLRILALSAANLDANVIWQYGPLVNNGWASESEFVPGARRTQTFLIATEGSSDTHILHHAFSLLRPEIADFFRFIDVTDRHPFSGAGNLLKFAEGLAKIDVHNQVIFLFDNDAEGVDTYRKVLRLSLPPNMHAMLLPDIEQFRAFPARGPDGVSNADINGRAAAIECYLDLTREEYPRPKVVWINYKSELDTYHGALEFKESYVKSFLRQTTDTVAAGSYDVGKVRVVLDALVAECCAIAVKGMASRCGAEESAPA